MIYSHEVQHMCVVKKGANHQCAPIPEEGKWVRATQISDISGLTHGIGWCAPKQGGCKLTLNVKEGIIQEALVETIGCSGMTHSAAMASEILPGKTLLEALNTDLVCDAINTAMRELFLQIVYGRTQSGLLRLFHDVNGWGTFPGRIKGLVLCQSQMVGVINQGIACDPGFGLIGFRKAAVNDKQFPAGLYRLLPVFYLNRHVAVDNMGAVPGQSKFF